MSRSVSTRRSATSGCAVTRFNAMRHGLLSRYSALPWEDEGEYDGLLVALVGEYKPQGPTEEHLVEELAGVLWRKRRLRHAEGAAYRQALKSLLRLPMQAIPQRAGTLYAPTAVKLMLSRA